MQGFTGKYYDNPVTKTGVKVGTSRVICCGDKHCDKKVKIFEQSPISVNLNFVVEEEETEDEEEQKNGQLPDN